MLKFLVVAIAAQIAFSLTAQAGGYSGSNPVTPYDGTRSGDRRTLSSLPPGTQVQLGRRYTILPGEAKVYAGNPYTSIEILALNKSMDQRLVLEGSTPYIVLSESAELVQDLHKHFMNRGSGMWIQNQTDPSVILFVSCVDVRPRLGYPGPYPPCVVDDLRADQFVVSEAPTVIR